MNFSGVQFLQTPLSWSRDSAQVAPVIHVLDTRQLGRPGIIAATALETSDGLVLFDTGPESTFENIRAELRRIGASENDVRHLFLSHIHFDHAGAAWRFAELGATIYVHPRGAPHLLDPSRLVESATRIFGDEMEKLWGRFAPVRAANLRVVHDQEVTRVGSLGIRALETPGHASHHHIYHWDDCFFGGDVAGVRIGNGPAIPPFVPPELDVDAWLRSIEKMRALEAATLYLPHFGLVRGTIAAHLDQLEERVRRWSIWFRDQLQTGREENELRLKFAGYERDDLRAHGASESEASDYEAADPSAMAVTASIRYWKKSRSGETRIAAEKS